MVIAAVAWVVPTARADQGVAVDELGTRQLSEAPPPGIHPRVYFSAEDLPALKRRMTQTRLGQIMQDIHNKQFAGMEAGLREFASLDLSDPTPEQVVEYVKPDEGRNIRWGMFAVNAVMRDNADRKALMAQVITNYARLFLASKRMSDAGNELVNEKIKIWQSDSFGVGESWTIGASGIAIAYDMLYNDMTPEQRDTVRAAIATGTKGRMSYGMGMPRGRGISNHYGYHGDLLVMLAAIEGEEGFDQPTYDRIKQVLIDYWEIGFTPMGACHEDAYGPTLGLRAGSRGMIALARRGTNLFATERYRNYTRYFAQELEPFRDGTFIGGASGNGLPYPTSVVVNKYMRPNDPIADYNLRYYMGDDYQQSRRWQGWLDILLFGMDYESDPNQPLTPELLEAGGLEETVFFPIRGKMITRSDWTPEALYFQLDARPDAFMIGHDKVDRGNFVLDALGRQWAVQTPWDYFRESTGNNLLHIDGKAQAWKAPSVDFLSYADNGSAATASADLEYAYDWQWSPPWPHQDKQFPAPWEPELNDPRDLGWPDSPGSPEWLPNKLYGTPDVGYVGSYMWRRPYNPVQKAVRSAAMVRGHHPYVVIFDDFRKDDEDHEYGWYMQLPLDVEIKSHNGMDVLLGEVGEKTVDGEPIEGSRRLLVRVLQADDASGRASDKIDAVMEDYETAKNRHGKPVIGRRLILSTRSVEPGLKIMLLPIRVGETMPETEWVTRGKTLNVVWPDQQDTLTFGYASESKPAIGVEQVLEKRSTPLIPLVIANPPQSTPAIAVKKAAPVVVAPNKPQQDPVASYHFDKIKNGKTGEPSARINGAESVPGKSGRALRFDGQSSYVALPTGLGSTQSGSIALSMRADKPTGEMAMMFVASPAPKSAGNGGNGEAAIFLSNRGNIAVGIGGINIVGPVVNDGQWHRVVATWETGGELVLYLDGQFIGSKTFNPNAFAWTGHTTLGKPGSDQRYFIGDLDEVGIYNRPLSPEEVKDPTGLVR